MQFVVYINDEEKSGVVVDNSCVFRIILNSVKEGQEAFLSTCLFHAFSVQTNSNSPPSLTGKLCFNLIG